MHPHALAIKGHHRQHRPHFSRLSPDGNLSHVSPSLKDTLAKFDEVVTGLAAGTDGLIYVASPNSIFKMKLDGTVTPLARPAAMADCDEDLPPSWRAFGFRGLDEDGLGGE